MNLIFSLFYLLSIFHLVEPLRFLQPRAGPQPLGIQPIVFQKFWKGKPHDFYFFSSIVTYPGNVRELFPTDEQLGGLVKQAFDEAVGQSSETHLAPSGMGLLVVGNQAIFSSPLISQYPQGVDKEGEKPQFFYDIVPSSSEVRQQLLECVIKDAINERHSHGGRCGEIVAMQTWSRDLGAKTSYWLKASGGTIRPCSEAKPWGCARWVAKFGIEESKPGLKVGDLVMSTQVPSRTTSYQDLFCEGWEERLENVPQDDSTDYGSGPDGDPTSDYGSDLSMTMDLIEELDNA
ncbi:hypothetical protein J1614_010654 [Plenodomus biglobosus]|nr:hypothetical protein J1614_010654 [Plenodomus biglobosus]